MNSNNIKRLNSLGILLATLLFVFSKDLAAESLVQDSLPAISFKIQDMADSLHSPTALAFPNRDEIWVTEQTGKLWVIKNKKASVIPLLDLTGKMIKVNSGYEERGLLGLAFHPKFKSNRKFYVFYSAPSTDNQNHKDVIAEYSLKPGATTINPNSGRIILTMEKPDGNHDGGCLQFGPDGFLYISFGDGGGQGDKHGQFGNGQNLNSLLGKILRINVNTEKGYLIPRDNPFVGKKDIKPEIWAYGFRNPYRFSFDRKTGLLFAGDVGQDLWEEVDIVKKGANYGWRLFEGTHCYNPATGCNIKPVTMPIHEYSHKTGVSVIGGYMYNGKQLTDFKNKYLFADWTGRVFYLQKGKDGWNRGDILLANIPPYLKILGFGEDFDGELYILTNPDIGPGNRKGSVYKVINNK